jgi:hypothetical protein
MTYTPYVAEASLKVAKDDNSKAITSWSELRPLSKYDLVMLIVPMIAG